MALVILDGNQSATTLSTIVVSSAHIPAHTVVSLGAQAISDIASSVSGSVVSISNFPASQTTTFGAVTGSVSGLNFPASQAVTFSAVSISNFPASQSTTFGAVTGSISVLNFPATQAISISSVTIGNSITISSVPPISGSVTLGAGNEQIGSVTASISGTIPISISSVTIGNFPATQTIAGTVTIGAGTAQIGSVTASISGTVPISISSVTIGNSITISSLPSLVAGTSQIGSVTASISGTIPISIASVTIGNSITISNFPATQAVSIASVTIGSLPALVAGTAQIGSVTANLGLIESVVATEGLTASGTFVKIGGHTGTSTTGNIAHVSAVGALRVDGSNYTQPISGTVEIAPNQSFNGIVVEADSGYGSDPRYMVVAGGFENTSQEFRALTFGAGSTLLVSGTVTANTFAVQGTAVTTSNFTSTTPSTVLAGFNASREVLTIFNEGAGNLHICAGATCTTIAYQVRLSTGDYFEAPNHQTTITHSAVFATAGTARVTEVS